MEVMLLTKIENLGELGDIVNVKSGYARNYLLPYGKAQEATPENIAELEARKAKIREELQREREKARSKAEKIDGKPVEFLVNNVNEEGKFPGSIGTIDIVEKIHELFDVKIERSQVRLSTGVFHEVGKFDVTVHLHADVDALVKLNIVDKDAGKEKDTDNDKDVVQSDGRSSTD